MEPFMTMIMVWPCNFAPVGWMFCAGQLLQISQYNALFALLGTTYGGDGIRTFQLPDLRGRVPVGAGQGASLAPVNLGEVGGSNNVTLTVNQMPAHNHTVSVTLSISASNLQASTSTPQANYSLAAPYDGSGGNPINGYVNAAPNTPLNVGSNNVNGTTGITGQTQPHSNMQPYLGLNYCIAIQGIFPSRS